MQYPWGAASHGNVVVLTVAIGEGIFHTKRLGRKCGGNRLRKEYGAHGLRIRIADFFCAIGRADCAWMDMWATWLLAASFTILILAGLEIVPLWSKPYPESAMFQALLVLMVAMGWGIGVIPVAVAVHRGGLDWVAASRAVRWCVVLGVYALVACGAVYAIAMGTERNASLLWKATALVTGFGLPAAFGFYLKWLLARW